MNRPSRPRIPPLDMDALNEQQRVLAQLGAANVVRTLARYEDLFPVLTIGETLLGSGRLSPRDRELAILRVALRTGCAYEWANHAAAALGGGASEEEIRALAIDTTLWPDADAALLRAVDELCSDNCVSDATWAALAATRDDAEIVELLFVAGFYRMMAGFLNSAGVQPEPGRPELGQPPARPAGPAPISRPATATTAPRSGSGPAGVWQITFYHPAGNQQLTLVLEVNNGAIAGSVSNPAIGMTVPIAEGTADGDRFQFRTPITTPFPTEIGYEGSVDGDAIAGTVTVRGAGTFPFDGVRA